MPKRVTYREGCHGPEIEFSVRYLETDLIRDSLITGRGGGTKTGGRAASSEVLPLQKGRWGAHKF